MTTSSVPCTAVDGRAPLAQLPSHAGLLTDSSLTPSLVRGSGFARPDALIVPSARPASKLLKVAKLAAAIDTRLVVLCSGQANVSQVEKILSAVPFGRGIAVDFGAVKCEPIHQLTTLTDTFRTANGGRTGDLSMKRNFGLLLARRCGWNKVVFLDDDVTVLPEALLRLARQLDSHQIAGMRCLKYPDNSVVCHARRLSGQWQDVFVSGAALGVNCGDRPLPFFPDIYNEDWFFFGEAAARRRLPRAGEAQQERYEPFASPVRAEHEEFGDLLAEGLYALLASQGSDEFSAVLGRATARYWTSFMQVRQETLATTRALLENRTHRRDCTPDVESAIASLDAAQRRYDNGTISEDSCVGFLDAWLRDTESWQDQCAPTNTALTVGDALVSLGATDWTVVR